MCGIAREIVNIFVGIEFSGNHVRDFVHGAQNQSLKISVGITEGVQRIFCHFGVKIFHIDTGYLSAGKITVKSRNAQAVIIAGTIIHGKVTLFAVEHSSGLEVNEVKKALHFHIGVDNIKLSLHIGQVFLGLAVLPVVLAENDSRVNIIVERHSHVEHDSAARLAPVIIVVHSGRVLVLHLDFVHRHLSRQLQSVKNGRGGRHRRQREHRRHNQSKKFLHLQSPPRLPAGLLLQLLSGVVLQHQSI